VAVVRLVWTLIVSREDGGETTSIPPRNGRVPQTSGRQVKIARYMSYEQ
jgi:hypothetical protein